MADMKKPELLLPAANLENLKMVIRYGADAVYLGGQTFSLRAMADNFTPEEMEEGIRFAHTQGKRVYVTANIYMHNGDIPALREYFRFLREAGPDAVLISDPGAVLLAKEEMPGIPIHISTQANNTNYLTWEFWHRLGVRRVVAARELTLKEIREIRQSLPADMEIEAFIHGAMCISYSGRCLLSNVLTGRDANRGACTHPCRWKYALEEETRPGEYFPIEEDERGSYIMNSRDLSMIEHVPELAEAGISSFKVEGRMKTALYAATVAKAYREAIDLFFQSEEAYRAAVPRLREEVLLVAARDSCTGFFFGKPGKEDHIYNGRLSEPGAVFMGRILQAEGKEELQVAFTQKNKFSVGEELELLTEPGKENIPCRVTGIRDEEGREMAAAPHPKQLLFVTLQPEGRAPENAAGLLLRRRR